MPEEAVLIATGADRPGVMDELSEFLLECGGHVTNSRSVNLRGIFALLLLVRGEAPVIDAIRAGIQRLAQRGIIAEMRPANPLSDRDANVFPFVFTANGTDQSGVLHRISHLLRALGVNIDNIETHVADNGAFTMRLDLAVPRQTPVTMLREYLQVLCGELKMAGDLREA
jgi:glycine cleavage system transcriptional repressor